MSLTKPKNVQECEKAPGGCVRNSSADAPIAPDTKLPADVMEGPEASSKLDGNLDTGLSPSDGVADRADAVSPDLTPDQRPSDPVAASESGGPADGKADLPADGSPGPEPGKEPGVEPGPEPRPEPGKEPGAEPGPEPGKEPGREPGPEPRPEPGKEPGPEPGPEPPRDGGVVSNCTIFFGESPATGSQGHPPAPGNDNAFCVATCDDIQGWGCSNFEARTVSVNGAAPTTVCGGALTKVNGYNVFKVSAGSRGDAVIYWWGTWATSCPAPDGGVF